MSNIINKLNNLEAQTLQNIKSSKSKNTLRAYKADISSFNKFCQNFNMASLPANPRTISLYITELSKDSKLSTIKRKMAAIKVTHKMAGKHIDFTHPIISENLNSIKKQLGTFQKSKKPISTEDLKKIISAINLEKEIKIRLRNKAIVLIGFAGAFRRSELVALEYDDLEFVNEGLKIFIKRSKTDQSGEGMVKAIPYFSKTEFCPVNSLKEWCNYSKDILANSKKVFNMSDKNVALIIKKYTLKVGLDSSNYSGHSLRSGFATSTAESGANERQIMNMTGHKSNQMVRRYIHESNLFKNNALKKINF